MKGRPPRGVAPCDPTPSLSGYLLFRDFCLKHLEEAKPLVEFYEEVRPLLPGERGGGWAAFIESARCLALAPPCHLWGSRRLDQEIREAGDRGRALGSQPGGLRHLHHEGAAGLLACECPGQLVLRPRPKGRPTAAWALGWNERTLRRIHSHLCLPQPFSKSATEHVQGHLVKKQVPPDLFQVCTGPIPCCLPAQPGSPLGS